MLDYAASQIREQLPQARHPPGRPLFTLQYPGSHSRGRSRLDTDVKGLQPAEGHDQLRFAQTTMDANLDQALLAGQMVTNDTPALQQQGVVPDPLL